MGRALEILSGFATAPDTTQTDITMAGSDSKTIRNANPQPPTNHAALLLNVWADIQLQDPILRIKSPRMHDNVQGIRLRPQLLQPQPLLPWTPWPQKLFPQDLLTIDLSGSATGSDIESMSMLVYYLDLPGIAARLFHPEEVLPRVQHIVSVENTITEGTSGSYTGSEAINAEFDLLKANTDYALLGYTYFETGELHVCSITWSAAEWGNLRLGGPGIKDEQQMTAEWFVNMSRKTKLPCIPVFNSSNAGNVNVEVLTDEVSKTPIVTSILGELGTAPEVKSGLKK